MNKVMLVGRLTRDPELRSLPSGKAVANPTVARYTNDMDDKQNPDPPADAYAARVAELESEGLTTSDAQGVADVELGYLAAYIARREADKATSE